MSCPYRIHIASEQEYNALMQDLEQKDYWWAGGESPTALPYGRIKDEYLAIVLHSDRTIQFSHIRKPDTISLEEYLFPGGAEEEIALPPLEGIL